MKEEERALPAKEMEALKEEKMEAPKEEEMETPKGVKPPKEEEEEMKPPKGAKGVKGAKGALSIGLFIVLIAWLAWYVWAHRGEMAGMLSLSPMTVAGMLVCAFGAYGINCLYHRVLLETYGFPMTLTDWMGVVSVSNCMAYVLPLRMDLVFSAAYYKRVKGLAFAKSASMAAGNIVFGVAFSLLQILAALVCVGLYHGVWPGMLWIFLAVGLVGTAGFIAFALIFQSRMPLFMEKWRLAKSIAEGFVALLKNRAMLQKLLVCLTLNHLFHLLLIMLSFSALGQPVPLYLALFFGSVSWLSSIVQIVPGNLGIKESMMGAATLLMTAFFPSEVIGVGVSLLHRAALMAVYLFMGACFAIPVYRRFTHGQPTTNAFE